MTLHLVEREGRTARPCESALSLSDTSFAELKARHHEQLSRLPLEELQERYRQTNRTLAEHMDAPYEERRDLAVASLVGASLILRHRQLRAKGATP